MFYKDLVINEIKAPFFDEDFFNENFL